MLFGKKKEKPAPANVEAEVAQINVGGEGEKKGNVPEGQAAQEVTAEVLLGAVNNMEGVLYQMLLDIREVRRLLEEETRKN